MPNPDYFGEDAFSYKLNDGELDSNPAQVRIAVTAVNDAPVAQNLSLRLDEDSSSTLTLNVSDVENDTLLSKVLAGPLHGSLSTNSDGSLRYTPNANYFGPDSFTYLTNDGSVDSNVATVSIEVLSVNDAPVAANDNVLTLKNMALQLDLLANDSDVDHANADLRALIVSQPAHGALSQNADGSYTYTPATGFTGTDSFSYQTSDGAAVSNLAVVNIAVMGVNIAPIAREDALNVQEDQTGTINVLANDSDADGNTLSARIVTGAQHGTVSVNADGTFSYTPNADYFGSDSFSYIASDGMLQSNPALVKINVSAVNDAPVARDLQVTLAEDSGQVIAVASSDSEGDALQAIIVTQPSHGKLVTQPDGSLLYTPEANYVGLDSFSYRLNDGQADSNLALVALQLTAVNDAPVAQADTAMVAQNTSIKLALLANDSDVENDSLRVVLVRQPEHGTLEMHSDGSVSYTPTTGFKGVDSFSYQANDGSLDSNVVNVSLTVMTVNTAPLAQNDQASTPENQAVRINVLANDTDAEGGSLQVTQVGQALHGSVVLNSDGSFTYTPQANYSGVDSFTYRVNDGELDSALAQVSIHVSAVNHAPMAVDDSVQTEEDVPLIIHVLANDSDEDSSVLTSSLVLGPQHGTLVKNLDGSYRYTPHPDYSGADSFTYKLSDGVLESRVALVSISVAAVADAPNLSFSRPSGRELFRTGWESVTNKNNTSSLEQVEQLEGWNLVTTSGNSSGGWNGFEIWSEGDQMQNQQNKMQIVHASTNGGRNWLELNDAMGQGHQTLGISRPINTVAGASYALTFDFAGRLGYSSEYTRIGIYLDNQKLATFDGTSPLTALNWQALQVNFNGKGGAQTLRIVTEATKRDANGRGAMLDNLALRETLPVNSGYEDSVINLSAITASLKDQDGSERLQVWLNALPVGATLSDGTQRFTANANSTQVEVTDWNLRKLTFLPAPNFFGVVNLEVEARAIESTNGSSASTTEKLAVTVLPVNDAPIALDDSVTLAQDSAINIDLKANDSDVDNISLSSKIITSPLHGKLSKNSDGTFAYMPNPRYRGTDSFSYQLSDGTLDSGVAKVSITVTAVNHAPVFTSTAPSEVTQNKSLDTIFQVGGSAGSKTVLEFGWTSRQALYNDEFGLFKVDDAAGRIGTLLPGDAGYAGAALAPERAVRVFASGQGAGASSKLTLDAGQFLGYYLVQNNSVEQWRKTNPTNLVNKTPVAFFSTTASNPDQFDHLRISYSASTGYSLQWEDLTGGGDKDYNDLVLSAKGIAAPLAQAFSYAAQAVDSDGDKLSYQLLAGPSGASINASTGLLSWDNPQIGTHQFILQVADGQGASTEQRFTLVVKTPPPVTKADSFSGKEDSVISGNVLANDSSAEASTTATSLSAELVQGPAHGQVKLNPDGSFDYTPAANFNGLDSFSYRALDGNAASSATTVSLNLAALNDAPVAQNAALIISRDTIARFDLAKLASDVDGDRLTVSFGQAAHGRVSRNQDGTLSYKPDQGFVGEDSFIYMTSDGVFLSQGKVSITVRAPAGAKGHPSATVSISSIGKESVPLPTASISKPASGVASELANEPADQPMRQAEIDWRSSNRLTQQEAQRSKASSGDWVSKFLGVEEPDLAKSSGLKITLKAKE